MNPVAERLTPAGRNTYTRLSALSDSDLRAVLLDESNTAIGALAIDLLDRLDGYKATLATATANMGGAARSTDPATSEAAGQKARNREGSLARFRAGTHRHRLLLAYATANRPLHDHEAAVAAGIDRPEARQSAGRRQSELRKVGYIVATGDVAVDPATGASGRLCIITETGRNYLAELAKGTP